MEEKIISDIENIFVLSKEMSPRKLAEIIEENYDDDDLTSLRSFDWNHLTEMSDTSFEQIKGIIHHAVINDAVKVVNFLLLIGVTPML